MTPLTDYYFDLPRDLIAQNPADRRDDSKLMIVDRKNNALEHKKFYNIPDYLNAGDVLVINESKVFPARLKGIKEDSGTSIEFLLLENKGDDLWEVLMKPGKKGTKGSVFCFGEGRLKAEIVQASNYSVKLAEFHYDKSECFFDILNEIGKIPLPPYIKESEVFVSAKERYQTVYAKNDQLGSAAAPTAGLHFTRELLEQLLTKGVIICPITLHVGLGTFWPVRCADITAHKMHEESYHISHSSAEQITKAKSEKRRVVAVGTTSCRTLEGNYAKYGKITPCEDRTDIFIYGNYEFRVTDALITNFHLPESTLLMLVSAFYTKDKILAAYQTAIENKYRFFSFGDAMLIV